MKQKLLILYSANSSLTSPIIGWSLYDGTGEYEFDASDEATPPYSSVLLAMRDGWRVIQLPVLQSIDPGATQQLSYLRFETVLEKIVPAMAEKATLEEQAPKRLEEQALKGLEESAPKRTVEHS